MYYCYLDTPIDELLLAGENEALCLISFPGGSKRRDPGADWIYNEKPLLAARKQLLEYFAGDRKDFDLPLRLNGGSSAIAPIDAVQKQRYLRYALNDIK